MSKEIVVLTPNGRRQKVQCTPNTSFLEVLEDVCKKQGFRPDEFDLKHHNHVLDLTSTIRWSNIPNKATLEMVEAERSRHETNVTIGLLLEDGERRTADFAPNTSLFELINSLAPNEFSALTHPTILYMRHEVTGVPALKDKTLRQMGLIGGRAILRLLNKAEEATQANVSRVYCKPLPPKEEKKSTQKISTPTHQAMDTAGPSNIQPSSTQHANKTHTDTINPIDLIKKEKQKILETKVDPMRAPEVEPTLQTSASMEIDRNVTNTSSSVSLSSQEGLERRLMIEEEVTFLGTQKAIVFTPKETQEELDDLPDDFYDLSVEEVRRLYKDLQQNRMELENSPLVPASKKQELAKETSEQRIAQYKSVVVRVQFPDHVVLQGIFLPTDTIQDVYNFIKEYLQTPDKPFTTFTTGKRWEKIPMGTSTHPPDGATMRLAALNMEALIVTTGNILIVSDGNNPIFGIKVVTPLKETLDPNMTLLEAKFVPCVHMHFRWLDDANRTPYLKDEIYLKTTPSDAASILASKYRAPSRRKPSTSNQQSSAGGPSSSKNSKVPKWFKN